MAMYILALDQGTSSSYPGVYWGPQASKSLYITAVFRVQ